MRVVLIPKTHNVRAKILAFVKLTAKVRDEMQALAANTLFHAAKHGDTSLINDFFKALSAGDQASFKRWVVSEVRSVYDEDTKLSDLFIGLKNNEFFVRKDTMPGREEFVNHVNTILADDAQADEYGKFFAIDPDKTKNPFNTLTLLTQLNNLVKKTDKEDSQVDPAASALLKELVAGFQAKTKDIVAAETHH